MTRSIPSGFTLGAATSAFQIEGAADGRGETIWDRFIAERGLPDDGRTACDHVRLMEHDLDLMAELGLDAYRFSVSWARILPDGRGRVDSRGLGFYDRLVDGLLERGITPWLTLFHWDLPQAIEERGGWRSRDTVGAFTDLVEVVVGALGDRVTDWITQNEPWVVAMLGHRDGVFAPGSRDMSEALTVAHHLLVSHGAAAQVVRGGASGGQVGIALDCRPADPASDHELDLAAAHHFDGFRHRWFLDPLFGRGYPADMVDDYRRRGLFRLDEGGPVRPGDLELIAQPLDVLGINFYTGTTIRHGDGEDDPPAERPGPDPRPGHTEMGWRIEPEVLEHFLLRITTDYGPPRLAITENGASFSDGPGEDGRVQDDRRTRYLHDHLMATLDARDAGVPVDAYFVWSLLDNLEWTSGFSQRFGLVWVDHSTQQRIVKESGRWLASVLAERRIAHPEER
jgi:beta-glucosidase